MRRRLIGMLSTVVIIPITVAVATFLNSLQTLVQIPVWLSSLVGTLLLSAGHILWSIRTEENEKHAAFLKEHHRLTHRHRCSQGNCPHPELHERKPIRLNVPKRMP